MLLNKSLLTSAQIAAFAVAAVAPQAAHAVDGTINITGTINSSTCKINGANSPAAVNVVLPTVSTTALTAAGAVAGRTAFSIALTGCGALTKATTFFEPGPTVLADGNLKNATGSATGVEVQLLNNDFSAIALNGATTAQNSQTVNLTGGNGTLGYYAQYFANAAVGAGSVSTSVQFSMIYQ